MSYYARLQKRIAQRVERGYVERETKALDAHVLGMAYSQAVEDHIGLSGSLTYNPQLGRYRMSHDHRHRWSTYDQVKQAIHRHYAALHERELGGTDD